MRIQVRHFEKSKIRIKFEKSGKIRIKIEKNLRLGFYRNISPSRRAMVGEVNDYLLRQTDTGV